MPSTKAFNPSAFASKHGLTVTTGNPDDIELMKLDPSETSMEDLQQKGAGITGIKLKKEGHPS
ncbi:hypothetical protein OE165_28470, partial [Escherichia coli]|uniref:hypothetical protein n=1 Tax=Escherichia coli TaxID=562 RepID=UPI0021F395EB